MMDPIDEYGIQQLKVIGCMKDLEVLYMLDPIDVHGVQQLKEFDGKKGLEVLYVVDPIDAYGPRDLVHGGPHRCICRPADEGVL